MCWVTILYPSKLSKNSVVGNLKSHFRAITIRVETLIIHSNHRLTGHSRMIGPYFKDPLFSFPDTEQEEETIKK